MPKLYTTFDAIGHYILFVFLNAFRSLETFEFHKLIEKSMINDHFVLLISLVYLRVLEFFKTGSAQYSVYPI